MKKSLPIISAFLFFINYAFAQSAKASLSSSQMANVSITNSGHDYSLIASFQAEKTTTIKNAIVNVLGRPTDNKDDLSVWFSKELYTVTLRSEKLIIDLDKKSAVTEIVKKFERLGEHISNIVSGIK